MVLFRLVDCISFLKLLKESLMMERNQGEQSDGGSQVTPPTPRGVSL